ncbi:MAG: DUF1003 domain-containing protein [Rickettsiales bacterium]
MDNFAQFDLNSIPLFANVAAEALPDLRAAMQPVSFAPGQTILREGEPGDSFFIILSGQVQFITHSHAREEVLLGEAGAGEYFGELALLTQQPRAARVRSVTATQMLTLAFDAFEKFLVAHPQAAIDVMKTLALRVYKSDALLRGEPIANVNQIDDARITFGARVSDWVAQVMGSWRFIFAISIVIFGWIAWNSIADVHNAAHPENPWPLWDQFPFILLNLGMSFLAVYSAPIIMMSQNRAADKDRLVAEIDHDINVRAELQIGQIIRRLDDLEKSIEHRLK